MKRKKTIEFVAAVFANLIAIAVVNTAMLWRQYTGGVILDSWPRILWAANLSLIMQVLGNLLLAMFRPARLYSLVQAILTAVGLVSLIVFYRVFPLDLSQMAGSWLNTLLRAALIIGMAGSSIGILVHLVRAVTGARYRSALTG